MHVFEFVLAIILITTLARVASDYLKLKKKGAALADENHQNDERINALEERVQTLERIVTDQKQTLKDKIDSL